MAKTVNTYKIVQRFIGSVVHTVDGSGTLITILLDVDTPQEVLEVLYNKGFEGVYK